MYKNLTMRVGALEIHHTYRCGNALSPCEKALCHCNKSKKTGVSRWRSALKNVGTPLCGKKHFSTGDINLVSSFITYKKNDVARLQQNLELGKFLHASIYA